MYRISSIFIFILSLIATIAFWYFIYTDYYDNWYPLVGHLISAHGALIAIIFWEYLEFKGQRSVGEQWDIWFKKRDKK